MPERTIFVAASDTEVGKTWVAARLVEALRQRGAVAARKPVQSFAPDDETTDADLLARASGEDAEIVCPPHRRYGLPLAPPVAARLLGRDPWTIADLVAEIALATGPMIVEGVGGPLSPLADDGDSAALARALDADVVVLVVPAGLGAINAARSGVRAFAGRDVVVFLNRFNADLVDHATNLSWLADRDRVDVATDIAGLIAAIERRATSLAPQPNTVEVP